MALRDDHARDAQLVRSMADGCEIAFRELYDRHQPAVFRLALGIVLEREEAREIVQEVFLRLHRTAHRWQPRASIRTWLYRVTLNTSLSWRRRIRALARPALDSRSRRERNPEQELIAGEAADRLRSGIAALTPRQRAVVTLVLDAGLEPSRIAPLLGISANAARVTLHRASRRLQLSLAQPGEASRPDSLLREG